MKESKVRDQGDDRLWTSNTALVARLFRIKVILLLKIMRIYNEPLLSSQPPLSGYFNYQLYFQYLQITWVNSIHWTVFRDKLSKQDAILKTKNIYFL